MPPSASDRRTARHTRAFYRLIDSYVRLHSDLGWAGLFILLLLLAANHKNGWMSR